MDKLKYSLIGLVAAATVVGIAATSGNESAHGSIATVDISTILKDAPAAKNVQTSLHKQFDNQHQALVKKQETFRSDMEKFNRDVKTMSASQKKITEDSISKRAEAFQKEQMAFQQEVMKAENDMMKTLMDKINATIATYAKDNGYKLVLNKSSVAYHSSDFGSDITSKVLSTLG